MDKNEKQKDIEKSIIKRFRKEIWNPFVQALKSYELISPGDSIAVCISGGKDSMLLAKCMQEIKSHGTMNFDLKFLVMDPGYKKENRKLIEKNADMLGIPIIVNESDIFEKVDEMKDSPCYMCARMRRGTLYRMAKEIGCNKIALGHHRDDAVETIMLSVLYGGQFNTMLPKLVSTNFPGMELIRPLYLVKEEDIIAWKKYNRLRFINCACRLTETEKDSSEKDDIHVSKRAEIKELLIRLRKNNPSVDQSILASCTNVNLDQCLGYVKRGKRRTFLDDYKKPARRYHYREGPSFVYLLRCADNSFYCGYTNDLEKRLAVHNAGKGAKYTRTHGPVSLVYHEIFDTQSEALKREKQIKKMTHQAKEKLVKGKHQGREDL